MDIGVITIKGETYHPNRRLLEAARARGLDLALINPYALQAGIASGRFILKPKGHRDLPEMVLPRQGAQIGSSSLVMLNQFQSLGIPVLNDVQAIRIASNKFLTLQRLAAHGLRVPDTCFANSRDSFWAGVEALQGYPLVGKGLNSRQGREVVLLENEREAEQFLIDSLEPARGLLLQQYLPPRDRQDFRVLIIGGRVIGGVKLQPPTADFRSNFHISSQIQKATLEKNQERAALASVRAVGLHIAGVDLVVDAHQNTFVLEVNYAPGFQGFEQATGLDVADQIIGYAVSWMAKA